MTINTTRAIAIALTLVVLGPTYAAAQGVARVRRVIDASVDRTTGDKIRGPATITVRKINVLRYDVGVGVNVTFTAGPDLTGLPFVPPAPAAGAEGEGTSSVERLNALKPNTDLLRLLGRLAGAETTYATFRGRVVTA